MPEQEKQQRMRKEPHKGTRADKPARPYVGDVVAKPKSAPGKALIALGLAVLSILVGFVIGISVYAVMNLSTWLTDLLWMDVGGALGIPVFPLIVCTLGGIIIGIWTWWSHDVVRPLEEVMAEFKKTGSFRTNGAIKPVVTFLLPLVFGGSVGFEAGLTGLISSGCCWIRDQLKRAGLRAGAVADVTIAASMAAIFRTPLAGIVAGAESAPGNPSRVLEEPNVRDYDLRRSAKVILYTAAALGAMVGVQVFNAVFGTSGGMPRFEEITATGTQLLWAIPCIALAYGMTLVFHGSRHLFTRVANRLGDNTMGTIEKPIIAGVIMGAVACALPYVLFPGETQSEELMHTWTTWSALALLGTGVLKAAITPMCIRMGWVGGDLFPSIFAGVAAGYGLAALTGADPMLMVTVTAAAFLGGVLRKPFVVLAILFLCFPADGILWMGISAVIGATLPLPLSTNE
ncbi:MAG: chloride channel protein [Coriobacteriales bacterium]|nr:chloride channel protein [Coriobacteriales bacterium]